MARPEESFLEAIMASRIRNGIWALCGLWVIGLAGMVFVEQDYIRALAAQPDPFNQ